MFLLIELKSKNEFYTEPWEIGLTQSRFQIYKIFSKKAELFLQEKNCCKNIQIKQKMH
jgi:hypothetical protein